MSRLSPPVGDRIRQERLKRGISLRNLAKMVGVSASLISQIETGKSQPSVSTLYAITSALEVSIEDVFETTEPEPVALAQASGEPSAAPSMAAVLASGYGGPLGPVVPPEQRERLELDSGVTWERLGHVPGTKVDFLLITYPPGASSSSTGQLMRHAGSEYGHLLQGELIVTLGFDEHRLRPGDSVCFTSTTPHRYRNDADQPAIGVWFVSESNL